MGEELKLSGTLWEGDYTAQRFYENAVFHYALYVPEICKDQKDCALLVSHDGLNRAEALAMEQLAETREMPPCVELGIVSATLPATLEGGKDRAFRMVNYDIFGPEYPDFVVEELIPWVVEKYQLSLSDSPDMHMVSGGSSGGISAWNMAWYRTDYFHRVYMSSPSFLAMGRGRELPALIRKCETKPIRVFTEYSENEPDEYFGSSFCAADDAERALRFAGYEMEHRFYPGEDHCSRCHSPENALERMRFLWKDWETEPVKVKRLSPRAEQVISLEYPWEETTEAFPEKTSAGDYIAEGEDIYFLSEDGQKQKTAERLGNITALAISSDGWRLYSAASDRGCVYAMSICPDGSLAGRYIQGTLHMESDFVCPGAFDLCVDANDRIFAATEMGIQCIRSFGLIDVILPLPGNAVPKRIAFGGENMTWLYADCGGKIFRRKMKTPGKIGFSEPQYVSYYD